MVLVTSVGYPVKVEATLDEPLSRWLWIVKWLLVIPHLVVLAFLWAAFVVLSVVAFFAILVTGRYPRAIFAFNVGVLRWTWRVSYYAYGALGTDQYPPFTLEDVPTYPAHLEISYPEQLSRPLVLVKTWLLAIPHYLVVGLFVGGAWFAWQVGDRSYGWNSGGLIGLLVLVAAVLLLVSGRYPRSLFDFILGMNRWALRVAAYAALMTDDYPPFRLDMGGLEAGGHPPAGTLTLPAPAPVPRVEGQAPASSGWTAGRVVCAATGALAMLLSLGMLGAAGTGLWEDRVQRDAAGYVPLGTQTLVSSGYAVASDPVHLHGLTTGWGGLASLTGDVRVQVTARGGMGSTFVGLGPASSVDRYLLGVAHTTVRAIGPGASDQSEQQGGGVALAPQTAGFWTTSASGPGTQVMTWTPRDGDWTLVALNADGSRGVMVSVALGAQLPVLGVVSVVLLVLGALVLAVGVTLLVAAVVRAGRGSRHGTSS
jgi:Domain of unknown function (DUF4389)